MLLNQSRKAFTAALLVAICLSSTAVEADIATPGVRRISYSASLYNASAFSDCVLIVHPYSTSSGLRTRQVGVLSSTAIPFGRWSGKPKVYSLTKSQYEARRSSYSGTAIDPKVIEQDSALKPTNLVLEPSLAVQESTGIVSIEDVIVVKRCDASGAELKMKSVIYRMVGGAKQEIPWGIDGKRPLPPGVAPTATAQTSSAPEPSRSSSPPQPSEAGEPTPSAAPSVSSSAPEALQTPTKAGCNACSVPARGQSRSKPFGLMVLSILCCGGWVLRRRSRY